jgi:TolA-binding protein
MKKIRYYSFTILFVILYGCAYYNTMFNAETQFELANVKLESSADRQVTNDIKNDYQVVIDKCWKLINIYGEDNSYADDALLMIGKSYFQMEDYVKAERFLNQFTLKYPDSDLLPEGYLWLGRAQIKEGFETKARKNLNKIISDDRDDEFMAIAWFSLAELEYKNQSYDIAINNYQECVNYTSDDALAARALVATGDILYESQEYDPAIDYYEDAEGYTISDELAFNVGMKKVLAMLDNNDPEAAISVLYNMQRDSRFINKAGIIDARLGDCYFKEEEYEDAAEQYQYVLDTYPRTIGSANAAYGLAQLTETQFADIDSAKKLYDRVKTENRNAEYIKEAGARAALLGQYLSIKSNLAKDHEDLVKIQNSDTVAVVDSDTTQAKPKSPAQKPAKVRTESDILQSINKNKFALAEFFLLTMQDYDSALVTYSEFIETTEDSALTPKAMYSLAYIYKFNFGDSLRAKSIQQDIIEKYPESPYALFLLDQQGIRVIEETIPAEDEYKEIYLQAEEDLYNANYENALESFLIIAEDDSGTIWAEKSRYAIAWTYEHYLDSLEAAIDAYETIVTEYPNTEIAKIAKNKIKPPPVEKVAVDSLAMSDSLALSDSTTAQENLKEVTAEDEENRLHRKRVDLDNIDDELPINRNETDEDRPAKKDSTDEN